MVRIYVPLDGGLNMNFISKSKFNGHQQNIINQSRKAKRKRRNSKFIAFSNQGPNADYHSYRFDPRNIHGFFENADERLHEEKIIGLKHANGVDQLERSAHRRSLVEIEKIRHPAEGNFNYTYNHNYNTNSNEFVEQTNRHKYSVDFEERKLDKLLKQKRLDDYWKRKRRKKLDRINKKHRRKRKNKKLFK